MKLTDLEKKVLLALGEYLNGGWREEGFSDCNATDLANRAEIGVDQVKGVITSLVKKEIFDVQEHEHETGSSLIYITSDDWTNPGVGGGWAIYDQLVESPSADPEIPWATDTPEDAGEAKETGKETAERVVLSSGIATYASRTVTIKCADCGAERIIKPQDEFQVKRCVACQKKHRNKQRAEKRKQANQLSMEQRVAKLKQHALDNYEDGGDAFHECWDDKDYIEFINECDEKGKNYIREATKRFKDHKVHVEEIQNA